MSDEVPDGNYGMETPHPVEVADNLAALSRQHDESLSDREQAWLNAADHYLRRIAEDAEDKQ
jgi:hypothetical protein